MLRQLGQQASDVLLFEAVDRRGGNGCYDTGTNCLETPDAWLPTYHHEYTACYHHGYIACHQDNLISVTKEFYFKHLNLGTSCMRTDICDPGMPRDIT